MAVFFSEAALPYVSIIMQVERKTVNQATQRSIFVSLFTFVQLSSQRISDKKTGQGRTAARTAHSTLAVDERCCRAGGTSPKVVETILCAGPNMPPTIRIVVNVSAKKLWRRVSNV